MSTSTIAIAVQVDGTAKAATDLATVDRAVREVEKGAKEAGNAGFGAADGLDKVTAAGKRLASARVWDSYKQGVGEAKSSTEELAKSLGTVRASANASNLKSHNTEIDRMAKLCGLSSGSLAGLVRQMDAVRRAEAFDNLRQTANLSTLQLAKLRAEMGDVRGAFGTLAAEVGQARLALAAVTAGAVLAGKSCLDAALQVNKLNKAYGTITGSAAGAQAQLETIREVSNRLGLEFYSTAEGAKTFFAAGKDSTLAPELNRIFEGVSSAGAALALSKDEMQGAFLAIGQMISKGKVQAEELRGQLGERLPGAFQLAAQAMGMTTAQLDKFMADGKLTAEMLLPKLATVLQDTFGGAAMEAANGLQGQINRLSTAWTDLKAAMVDSKSAADAVGVLAGVLQTLAEYGEMVTASLAWAAWTAGAYGLIKAFTALRAVFAAINFASMATAATTLTAALGPVGLAAVAGLATVGITKLVSSTQSADDIFKRHQGTIDAYREKMGLAAQAVEELGKKQDETYRKKLEILRDNVKDDTTEALQGINSGLSGIGSTSMGNFGMESPRRALGGFRKQVEALGNELAALGDKVTKQDLDTYAAKVLAVDERVRAAGLASREWNTEIAALVVGGDSFVVKLAAMVAKGRTLSEELDKMRQAGAEAKAELASGWSLNVDEATKGVATIMGKIRGMEADMAGMKGSKVLLNLLPDVSVEKIGQIKEAFGKNGYAGALNVAGEAVKDWSTEQRVAFYDVLNATKQLDAVSAKHKAYTDAQRKSGKSVADSAAVATTKLDALRQEVENLEAANIPAAKGFEQIAAKLALERDQAIDAAKAHEKLILARKQATPAQAAETKRLEIKKAELTYTQKISEAESKNAEVRLDFEKRYADMVGATSQGIIESIRKQSAEYASAGADRVRLAEWERDQIQRASTDAWDGAQVALRDYSTEASNQAKGMNQAFGDLFSGIDSGFNGMWADLIENGKISLSSFRSMFASFLADLMHMAVTRPITVSIAGAVGGMFGGSGTANAGGIASGQMGGGGYESLLSTAIPKDFMGNITGGITNTINSTMAGWFPGTFAASSEAALGNAGVGLLKSQLGGGSFGPTSTFLGSVGPALGAGALGGLGYSLLGGAIGLPQGKYSGITSSLGGAAGWGLGSLAASSLAGGGGALAGAAAGSVIPVIGTILGALGGGLLGSLFGSERKTKPSVYTQGVNMPISSQFDYTSHFMGNAWYDRAGTEEAGKVMPILGEAAKVSAQQIEALVAALPEEFRGEVEKEIQSAMFDAGPATPGMDKHNWNFQFYDEEQLKERLEQVVKDIQLGMGKVAQEAMAEVDLTSMYNFDLGTSEGMDKAVKAVTSVKEITEATKEISEPASQLVAQAKAAKKQMDEWTKSMQEYGVVGEYANKVVDAYRQANIDAAMKDIADATRQVAEPVSQLVQQAEAAKKQMDDWLAAMKEYGANMDEVNAAVAEYQRVSIKANIDAIEASINPLSQYEQAVKAANQSVDDHKTALAKLGTTEAEIARVEGLRAGVLESLTGAMTLAFAQDLQIRQAQLYGNADLLASTQLTIQHERELADVRDKFGASSSQYAQILAMQEAERAQLAWTQAIQAQAKVAQDALNEADAAANSANSALSSAQQELDKIRSAYLAALNKEANALKTTVDSVTRAVDQIKKMQMDLRLNAATSTLSVADRYTLAGAELDRVFAKAMSGDADAMNELTSLSSAYLDASKEANADFSKYRKDFEKVQGMLGMVEASGLSQVDTAQKQLDLLNAQIAAATEGTGQIVGSIKELEAAFLKAMGDYTAAQEAARKAQEAAEEARRKAEEAANKGQNGSGTSGGWMQGILEKKAADINAGRWGDNGSGWTSDRVLEAIRATGLSFEQWYSIYGKAEGYAKGGLAAPGWAMVGEQGPELVNFSQPGRVYTADETADMLAPRMGLVMAPTASADSQASFVRELVTETKALRKEVAELRAEQSRSQFRIADALQRLDRRTAGWDYDGMPEVRRVQ